MPYSVYVLYSDKHDRFYYGQTNNLNERLIKHNKGLVKSTAPYIPWEIFAFKVFPSRAEAIKTEKMLKNLKSRSKVRSFLLIHSFSQNA